MTVDVLAGIGSLTDTGLNTAAVVLLYKLHRDIRDVAAAVADVSKDNRRQWGWIVKIRKQLWPELYDQQGRCRVDGA